MWSYFVYTDSDGTAFEVQDLEGNYGVTTTTKRTRGLHFLA